MVQFDEISYFFTHTLIGARDSINLSYAASLLWQSKKIRKVTKLTMIPNLAFLVIYMLLQFWTIVYIPLITIQFLVNYFVLLKSRDSLKGLFGGPQVDIVDYIADIITDSIFCNITLISSTLLYVIFRSIGVLVPVCQVLYALVYSIIIGYTICTPMLVERGLTFEQRLSFVEQHLVYIVGYGLPLTIGYNILPLVVYFALQSVLMPLMIINSRQHFNPLPIPGGPIKLITCIGTINKKIFFELLGVYKIIFTKSSNEEVQMAAEQKN